MICAIRAMSVYGLMIEFVIQCGMVNLPGCLQVWNETWIAIFQSIKNYRLLDKLLKIN